MPVTVSSLCLTAGICIGKTGPEVSLFGPLARSLRGSPTPGRAPLGRRWAHAPKLAEAPVISVRQAVDAALTELREVKYPVPEWAAASDSEECYRKARDEQPPAYITEILDKVQVREGGELKVSQLEVDGCVPVGRSCVCLGAQSCSKKSESVDSYRKVTGRMWSRGLRQAASWPLLMALVTAPSAALFPELPVRLWTPRLSSVATR